MNAKDKNQYFDSESGSNDLALVAVCNAVRFSAVLGMFGHRAQGCHVCRQRTSENSQVHRRFRKNERKSDLLANTTNDCNGKATVFPQSDLRQAGVSPALFFPPVKPLCTAIVVALVASFIREKAGEPLVFASILFAKLWSFYKTVCQSTLNHDTS